MARTPTTTDAFNAIAEPRRRQIVELLARQGAMPVSSIVETMQLPQPSVSKHLGVLRAVGLVHVSQQGKQRLYQLDATKLKTVHDWVKTFEDLWEHQLNRIKARAEQLADSQKPRGQRRGNNDLN